MQFNFLDKTPIEEIVNCLLAAFADYSVPMPEQVAYWEDRFRIARVDYSLSPAVFDEAGKLVAFIINAVDVNEHGQKVAYNTGTGVIPTYRGRQLVDQMYTFATPALKAAAIDLLQLEMISTNDRARRVYERIGFEVSRDLKCYHGDLPALALSEHSSLELQEIACYFDSHHPEYPYSWDNSQQSILTAGNKYKAYQLVSKADGQLLGKFIIDPKAAYLTQLETTAEHWPDLFAAIGKLTPKVKINNIDSRRADLIRALEKIGIPNVINQVEMERSL